VNGAKRNSFISPLNTAVLPDNGAKSFLAHDFGPLPSLKCLLMMSSEWKAAMT
jgi:hypothetical protein